MLPTPNPLYPGGEDTRPPKMHPERKALWVAALRSGEYKQARYQLRTPLFDEPGPGRWGYCCLGVACNTMDPNRWVCPSNAAEGVDSLNDASYEEATSVLPNSVIRWLWDLSSDAKIMGNMCDPHVLVTFRGQRRWARLSALNDDYDWGFRRIANVIEEQL